MEVTWEEKMLRKMMVLNTLQENCICRPNYQCSRCHLVQQAERFWPDEYLLAIKTHVEWGKRNG